MLAELALSCPGLPCYRPLRGKGAQDCVGFIGGRIENAQVGMS